MVVRLVTVIVAVMGVVVATVVEVAVVVAVKVTGVVETSVVVRGLPVPARYPPPAPNMITKTRRAAMVPFFNLGHREDGHGVFTASV
jgi:hypothetical protein